MILTKNQKKWRLLKDYKKGKYCFLIGVDNWSIELQKSEFKSLYLLLLRINEQFLGIKNEKKPQLIYCGFVEVSSGFEPL